MLKALVIDCRTLKRVRMEPERPCDIVSLHIPRTESSAGLIDRQAIAAAKPGFLLINAARGGLIDEAALLEAIDSGQCGGAAIDVFEIEPPPADSPLRAHPVRL